MYYCPCNKKQSVTTVIKTLSGMSVFWTHEYRSVNVMVVDAEPSLVFPGATTLVSNTQSLGPVPAQNTLLSFVAPEPSRLIGTPFDNSCRVAFEATPPTFIGTVFPPLTSVPVAYNLADTLEVHSRRNVSGAYSFVVPV
jgi:hypothetical protein